MQSSAVIPLPLPPFLFLRAHTTQLYEVETLKSTLVQSGGDEGSCATLWKAIEATARARTSIARRQHA